MPTNRKLKSDTHPSLSRRRFLHVLGGGLGGALGAAAAAGCTPQASLSSKEPPLYVDDGLGWPVFRGPYLQRQANIAALVLDADGGTLSQLCERCLNAPAGGQVHYTPLAPYVLLLFADMIVSSLDERDRELGWMREAELSFWLPTLAHRRLAGVWMPDHIAWFLPYLFVDNPYAIATGREVYGFPKTFGCFEKPARMDRPELSLDVWGFERFGPAAEGKLQRLLEIRQAGETGAEEEQVGLGSWDELRARLEKVLGAGAETLTPTPPPDLSGPDVPLVFLKQFRAAADTRRACYQAIVEARARVQAFRKGGVLKEAYQVNFSHLESLPLPQALGLAGDDGQAGGPSVPARTALWIELDFSLGEGVELWRA
ncbi:MAG: hypothetical protein JW850_07600 [Thermoflexales bacterium]|nr:hypothetical protein [Thermoflexales bacterium]